jgi:CRP/FNR family transcriptional regulator
MTKLTAGPARALEHVSYLEALPASEIEALAAASSVRTVNAGRHAFEEGDPPAGVFLILEGRIQLVRASAQGRQQVLHEEGPGATLAEVPVFDGKGYIATALAVEDSVLLFVPRAPLLAAVQRHPGAVREVIRLLASRVRRFAALAEELSTRSVTERLAGYLVRESDRAGSAVVDLPATRDRLAAHIGTVREQASRALSQLKRAGLVEIEGRRLRVRDRVRLRAVAGEPD